MDRADERDDVERSIIQAVQALIGREAAVDERTTLAELGIDSFGLVELAISLEQTWAIELRPDDYDAVQTVGDLVALVTPFKA